MVFIANELKLLEFSADYDLKLENDEILLFHLKSKKEFSYTKPKIENDPEHKLQKELFMLKKSLIENCLFGADINPNSCEITKLRLWIELLKFSHYIFENEKNTNTLETLPNIDINIKCGNSLLSNFPLDSNLTIGQTREFTNNLKESIATYKASVSNYKNNLGDKAKINENIKKIKETLISYLSENNPIYIVFLESLKKFVEKYSDVNFDLDTDFGMEVLKCIREKKYKFQPTLESLNPPPIDLEAKKQLKIIESHYQALNRLKNSDAFEWRFEFPEVLDDEGSFLGFDLIIGNPPYIRQESIPHKAQIKEEFKDFFNATADIYTYFFAKGLKILKPNGIISFITSNKWTRAGYGKNLRALILKNAIFSSYVDFNGVKVFDSATVDTSITTLKNTLPSPDHKLSFLNCKSPEDLNTLDFEKIPISSLSDDIFTFSDANTLDLKAKIESIGTPLKDWDIEIKRGVLTGYNEAFIISSQKREEILNACDNGDQSLDENGLNERERTEELIKPVLRGRDIKRYSYQWAGLWLIFIPWHFPNVETPKSMEENEQDFKSQYSSLYTYLLSHKDRLLARNKSETGIRYEWYCLQRWGSNYWQDFAKEKIVWNPVSGEYFFTHIQKEMYFNNSLFMITSTKGDHDFLLYILGLMNSTLYKWLIVQMTNLIEVGQYAYGAREKIQKLPIPKIDQQQEKEFIEIVRKILESKKQNKSTEELEKTLDSMVFKLYNLSKTEINAVLPPPI